MLIQELVQRYRTLAEWCSLVTRHKFFIIQWWYLSKTFKIKKIVKNQVTFGTEQ